MSSSSQDTDIMSSSAMSFDEEVELATNNFAAMSLSDYYEILEIPYEEIESATNNFADENLLTQGSSFTVYKCLFRQRQSSDLVSIVARKSLKANNFLNELIICKDIKHKNIVSTFRIATNEEEGIIINKHEANGSLDKHLSDPTLTWLQRLHICVKVAVALKYLHYDAQNDHYFIHENIKSSKILLDHNWEPKLLGFGFAVKVKKHNLHFPSKYEGTLQYMDPAYENNKALTHKSDVFSFGVMLFEILFGQEASIQNDDIWYFTRLARSHYEGGTLDDLISSDLRKQMNLQSFNVFAKTGYFCLKEQWSQRPDINQVLSELEKALELQEKHERPRAVAVESTSFNHLKGMLQGTSLNHLKFRLSDIELATNNFSESSCIGSGGHAKVYKAELEHFDGINLSVVEGKNKGVLPKKHSVVAIKRIYSTADKQGQQGFFAEIEMLSKCRHPNIVSLLGFCDEGSEMILVYEYLPNGSLEDYLENTTNMKNLTWAQRIHICLDIAHGLEYLHTSTEDKQCITHRDIKSANVLLDDNWVAKIADFGLSKLHDKHHERATAETNNIAGTDLYLVPEYLSTGKLKTESDIYSFGVVLFEMMCGKLAYDKAYNKRGLPSIVRQYFQEGKLKDLVDPKIKEVDENISMLTGWVNQYSLNTFSEVAYQCLAETQSDRPTTDAVIEELVKALNFQERPRADAALNHLKIQLSDIKLATNNFSESCCIGSGGYGKVYKAELEHFDGINLSVVEGKNKGVLPKKHSIVAIKRIFSRGDKQGQQGFFAEIEMLSKCRHPNIVSLLGFCDEGSEMILVYEYMSNGSLDDYLGNTANMTNLTWAQRIQICLDIAHGLKYLHTSTEDKQCIIHRDIKSANILLDDKWVAKISDFGLSKLHHARQQRATLLTNNIAGTELYLDPEYLSKGKLKTESDIYSFGVVLFEMMCGKLAYDQTYNEEGLPSIARQYFKEGNWKNLVDPKIKEVDENISMLRGGVNQHSLNTFSEIAYQCLAVTQSERPTMDAVIEELVKALNFQKTSKDKLLISLKALILATQNFSDYNCIGEGRFWKLYEGEVVDANGCSTPVVAKRWDRKSSHGHILFLTELRILLEYRHENIVGLVGCCNEMDENIIVYEHASHGRLDKHLDDTSLTWMKRLKIAVDVANGLKFLHKDGVDGLMHTDIKSGSILLDGDWNAKIYNFELSSKIYFFGKVEHFDRNSLGYIDPVYTSLGVFGPAGDIYSLGVILVEMLCGRLAWVEGCEVHSQSLGPLVVRHYHEKENLYEIVYEPIREQIAPRSLNWFVDIAFQCLEADVDDRPTASKVVDYLTGALQSQEDYEIWKPKLPIDYKAIIRMSKYSNTNISTKYREVFDMFSKGILLQDGKMLFTLGGNGERNEMISATMFSYKNRMSYRWQCVRESRFHKVAEIFDISKMKIRIKITTQFLSPHVNYGAYIIFKFCDTRKLSSKPMYVNLKYKKGRENLHAYFATKRDDEWMMIELFRFFSDKKNTNYVVLLESFSRYYCGKGPLYIEGIEFRVINDNNVKNEEMEEVQQILKSNSNKDQLLLNEVNRKKHLMLSPMEVFYGTSIMKSFQLGFSGEYRFYSVLELLPNQVFRIKCKIQSQVLSPDTEYLCYLLFELSEQCRGLHCPVKVRDLLHRNNKEAEVIYFRSPSPWNLHENNRVPRQREDGCKEVKVWKFNSNHQLKNGRIPVNLKLITYEGTMSGLILCGLEFRPM